MRAALLSALLVRHLLFGDAATSGHDGLASAQRGPSGVETGDALVQRRRASEARPRGHGAAERKPFIYVYELPPEYNARLQQLPAGWHSDQYDFDVHLHEYLLASAARTRDPDAASMFFVPVYLGRLLNWFWTRPHCAREADDPLYCMREPDAEPWWEQHWVGATNATSHVVRSALGYVRQRHPYWNRTDGADHFLVYSYDRGRCDMGTHLSTEDVGQSFAVMSYGDLAARSVPVPSWYPSDSAGGWQGPAGVSCVRPDADIMVPMYLAYTAAHLVSPLAHGRNISVLLRFGVDRSARAPANHGHRLRNELEEAWAADPVAGSDMGVRSVRHTEEDMRRAVFCVCPPGTTQDSTRVWRAIVFGCIPVTYFRAVELPFMRRLGIDYGRFSVNIQPDDFRTTQARLREVLARPERVRALQQGLAAHQRTFLWAPAVQGGVFDNVERELAMRAAQRAANETPSVF